MDLCLELFFLSMEIYKWDQLLWCLQLWALENKVEKILRRGNNLQKDYMFTILRIIWQWRYYFLISKRSNLFPKLNFLKLVVAILRHLLLFISIQNRMLYMFVIWSKKIKNNSWMLFKMVLLNQSLKNWIKDTKYYFNQSKSLL